MTATTEPLPFVDDPMLTAAGLSSSTARPPMGYGNPGRGYVQVPVAMLEESAETVLIVSMLARRLRASSGGLVERVLQTHLAYELGWIDANEVADHDPKIRPPKLRAAVNRVSGWVQEAASTPWMDVQYAYDVRRQRTMARYRLWGRPSAGNKVEYVEAPARLFDLVADGKIDKNAFVAFLRWRVMMRAATATNCSVPQFAERWKLSEATARRHRKALLKAEALIEVAMPGAPSITALPTGMVRKESRTDGAVKNRELALAEPLKRPLHGSWPSVPGLVPNPVSISPSAAADVQGVTRETATAASPNQDQDSRHAGFTSTTKPRRQASASSVAAAGRLLARFRADLVSCEPRFRRNLIRRAALFLDDGYGTEAVVRAANELTAGIADGNHCEAFRHALASLASDVLAGACKACGRYREAGHHSACEQAEVEAVAWFDEIATRDCCVVCDAAGSRREDLPIPVVVCDGCWDRQQELDSVEVGSPCDPLVENLTVVEQVNQPSAKASGQSCGRQQLHGTSSWRAVAPSREPRGRPASSGGARRGYGRQGPIVSFASSWRARLRREATGQLVRRDLNRSMERGRCRELARQGVP